MRERFCINFRQIRRLGLWVALVFVLLHQPVYSFGSKDTEYDPNAPLSEVGNIQDDPIISAYLENLLPRKPSLSYLRARAGIKIALLSKDNYKAISESTDMISVYGDNAELLADLADTYYALGDQENAKSYYEKLIEKISTADHKNDTIQFDEIRAHYKLAYISYQQNEIQNFVKELEYINSIAPPVDLAVSSVLNTQGIDYTVKLFMDPIDFSFIAKRELGYFYQYTSNILEIRKKKMNEAAIADSSIVKDTEEGQQISNMYEGNMQFEYANSIPYLFSSLFMAVDSLTHYVNTHLKINYRFSTLQNLIEMLRESEEGRSLLIDFDLRRILIAIKNYYVHKDLLQKDFKIYYIDLLIQELNFDPDTNEISLTTFYPNFN